MYTHKFTSRCGVSKIQCMLAADHGIQSRCFFSRFWVRQIYFAVQPCDKCVSFVLYVIHIYFERQCVFFGMCISICRRLRKKQRLNNFICNRASRQLRAWCTHIRITTQTARREQRVHKKLIAADEIICG